MTDDSTLRHNTEQQRYELVRGDEVAGFAHYTETEDALVFDHTVVAPEHRGGGAASRLVRYALDEVRANSSKRVVPTCSYVAAWLQRHEEYSDLIQR